MNRSAASHGSWWSCHVVGDASFYHASVHELHAAGNGSWLAIGGAGDWCPPMASCIGYPLGWMSRDGWSWSAAIRTDERIGHGGAVYAGTADGFLAVAGDTTGSDAEPAIAVGELSP